MILGIDCSHWCGDIKYDLVESTYKFGFFKCSEGNTLADSRYKNNINGFKDKLLRGSYHFWRGKVDPISQMEFYLNNYIPTELPLVLDVEDTNTLPAYPTLSQKQQAVDNIKSCLSIIQNRTKRTPIIYTAAWYWNRLQGVDLSFCKAYPLWVANYKDPSAMNPLMPIGFNTFKFWQYSDRGTVGGISASVDLNIFNGTLDELYNLCGLEAPGSDITKVIKEQVDRLTQIKQELSDVESRLNELVK